jgi:ribose/xylose/arabinose/galactoside ABC-type transport system permease subunit
LNRALAFARSRRLATKAGINVVILLLLVAGLALISEHFLSFENLRNVLRQISVVAIVASAVTLVMIAGGLDLSVGGVVALSGVVSALLAVNGLPIPLAFAAGVATGAVVGFVNGFLVVQMGLNSVIATLGTLYMARGVASLMTGGVPVHNVPAGYSTIGTGFIAGIPIPVLIMLAVVVVFAILQRATLLGKYAIAIGSNFEAARLAGIRVNAVRMTLYVLSGTMAGLGGILISSRLSSGQPTAASGLEFDVIVAAILGGVSLAGGEGSVIGTLIGALILGVISNGLNILGVEPFWQTILQGVILVVAVSIDIVLRGSGRRLLRRLRGGLGVRKGGSAASADDTS